MISSVWGSSLHIEKLIFSGLLVTLLLSLIWYFSTNNSLFNCLKSLKIPKFSRLLFIFHFFFRVWQCYFVFPYKRFILTTYQKTQINKTRKMHVRVNSKTTVNTNNSYYDQLLFPSKMMKLFSSEIPRLRRRTTTSHAKTGSSKMHTYNISLHSCVFLPLLLLLVIGKIFLYSLKCLSTTII